MTCAQPYSVVARLQSRWQQFADDRRGLAAVEFALIAAPFFFLIFGLLEVCLIFIMSTVMEHAVSEAARPLRTGEAQQAGITDVQFRQSFCNEVFGILECDARLSIDVRTVSNFAASPIGAPIDEDGELDDDEFRYEPGGPNDIVAVRAFYEWDLITPLMSKPLANMAGDRHLLQASAVFRNEPFGS
jgi:Flp pilus assembly protein TadG